jgi:phosphatidylinositol alpha-1,6-mannosyltransferase
MHKILLVSSEFPPGPGGIGHHAFSLCKELQKKENIGLTILCNADYVIKENIQHFDKTSNLDIIRFKRAGKFTQIVKLIQFFYIVNKVKPETIIFTGLFSLWTMNILVFGERIKKIAIIHGHEPIFGSKLSQWLTYQSFKKANHFVTVSRFSKTILEKKYLLNPNQSISIIPNGIDVDYLSSWNLALSNSLDMEALKVGFPRLLTIGHTSPRKGQHNVINALQEIKKIYPKVIYYVVGRDVNNKGLIEKAKMLGVIDNIQFIPPTLAHFQLLHFYNNADIFMLLSENQPNGDVEGFGIVALEANFFGVPVIGSKGCGVEDAVEDGFSGFLVNVQNCEEISVKVRNIIQGYDCFSTNAKEFANRHNWSSLVKKYESILCAE